MLSGWSICLTQESIILYTHLKDGNWTSPIDIVPDVAN